jgi:hypothetical protein
LSKGFAAARYIAVRAKPTLIGRHHEYCQRPPQLTEFPRNTMGAAMSISVST